MNLRLNPRYVVHKSEKEEVQHRRGGRIRGTAAVLEIESAEGGASSHDQLIIHECGRVSMTRVAKGGVGVAVNVGFKETKEP